MSDIAIRTEGCAGRITLTRPGALNALTWGMVSEIARALDTWAAEDDVALVLIDAEGDKAFSAGGDIAELYRSGRAGDYAYGRTFWRDEYRVNARLARFAKPVVSFLQGFTMGGGVGVGCHAAHRIVGDTSRIAMPECGIGLVPDVGGSLLLARAPGRLGAYLGTTGARMGPGDAIHAGFADHYLPEDRWDALKAALCDTGDPAAIAEAALPAPDSTLAAEGDRIDSLFAGADVAAILDRLAADDSEIASRALKALRANSPLSVACTLAMLDRLGPDATIEDALDLEFRFTWRAMERGDFLEGIRAAIIDKDKSPRWRHATGDVPAEDIEAMLAPLGDDALTWEERT